MDCFTGFSNSFFPQGIYLEQHYSSEMSYECTASVSNLQISHERSVPFDHASLDSMLQSSSSGYHPHSHAGNEAPHTREDLRLLEESSG